MSHIQQPHISFAPATHQLRISKTSTSQQQHSAWGCHIWTGGVYRSQLSTVVMNSAGAPWCTQLSWARHRNSILARASTDDGCDQSDQGKGTTFSSSAAYHLIISSTSSFTHHSHINTIKGLSGTSTDADFSMLPLVHRRILHILHGCSRVALLEP